MMKHYNYLSIIILFIFLSAINTLAQIKPVVFSEIFYDSPLEEAHDARNHNNGEFIELFNPSSGDIDLSGWKIWDNTTEFIFPNNTILHARSVIIIAYRYPNSGFKLNSLFPSLNAIDNPNIIYQDKIILSNDGENIQLIDKKGKLIDQMSYQHRSTFGANAHFWKISASNGRKTSTSDGRTTSTNGQTTSTSNSFNHNLKSIHRANINTSTEGITPLLEDYTVEIPSPGETQYLHGTPFVENIVEHGEIDLSLPVGSLPGAAAITPTGAATYQIPIACPPGTNGMQPNLSIVYNSQGGQGLLGLGWDIAGLSTISRAPKNNFHDDENGRTIAFDNTDCLTLDGQRLILLSGDNLTNGAIYGTEFENFSRVKIKNTTNNNICFELTTLDGKTIEYGGTTDANIRSIKSFAKSGHHGTLTWRINKMIDAAGNVIEYSYNGSGNINEIKYIKRGDEYINTIRFIYNNYLQFAKVIYINGFWMRNGFTLNNIELYNNGKKLKTYKFKYLRSDRDERLNTVTEENSFGKAIATNKINWGKENTAIQLVTLDKMPDNNLNNVENSSLYMGDIDGDGKMDKIEMWTGSEATNEQGYIRVILNNGQSLELYRFESVTKSHPNFKQQLVIGDINNDGKDDIIFIQPTQISLLGISRNRSNIQFLSQIMIVYATERGNLIIDNDYNYNALLMDYNSDERLDLIIVPYLKEKKSETKSENNKPTGLVLLGSKDDYFSRSTIRINIETFNKISSTGQQLIGNFDVNGKITFMELSPISFKAFENNTISIFESISWAAQLYNKDLSEKLFDICMPIDYNNDGLTDLLVQANDHKDNSTKHGWFLLKNNTEGYYNYKPPTKIDLPHIHRMSNIEKGEECKATPIDYNGDGAIDLIIGDETFDKQGKYVRTQWHFYKNVNGSFVADGTHVTNKRISKMNPIILDINNDGVQDLVFGSGDSYIAFTIPNASSRYRVESISNGLGQSDKFLYSTNYYQLKPSTKESIININKPFLLATSYEDKNGIKTNYKYDAPVAHTKGKGFLGFETITSSNPLLGVKTVTNYEVNTKYYGLELKSQEVFDIKTNELLSKSTQINEVVDGNSPSYPITKGKTGTNRFLHYVSTSTSTDNITGITQTTNNLQFDANWNVTKQESKMGDATKITETTYVQRNGQGIAYLPENITVTQKKVGLPDITSQTNYADYNAAGQVGKVTTNPNTDAQIITEYKYYPTGNLESKKVKPIDLKEQSTSYGYDSFFRLNTSTSNSLGQTTSTTYDYATGNVLTKTDEYGFVTEYKYNEYGQLETELLPNGDAISYKTEWTNAHNAIIKKTVSNSKIKNTNVSYFDKYGREIYSEQTAWKGNMLTASKEYNNKGQAIKVTLPHYAGETALYTTYEYNDIMGRVTKETVFDGKQTLSTNYKYSKDGDGNYNTTITPPNAQQAKTEIRDKHNLVVKRTDAGGEIDYKYNAAGQPIEITSNGSKTEIQYDDFGNQTLLKDPNAGNISFTYFANGLLETQTNAKGDVTEMIYDDFWRVDTKKTTEKANDKTTITKHSYVPAGNGRWQIESIALLEQGHKVHEQVIDYNDKHLPKSITDKYDDQTVVFSKTYDDLWRPLTSTSPSGLTTTNKYNEFGDLEKILSGNTIIWQGNEQNSKGQFKNYTLGNGLITTRSYSDRGELEGIRTYLPSSTTNIQHNAYTYFDKTGNLKTRNDVKNNRNEVFEYDELDRLTKAWLNGTLIDDMTYHPNGNINTKSDVGTYRYATPRPHAMSGIDNAGEGITNQKQFIEYTAFNKVSRITQGINELNINRAYDIFYGLDEQRIKTMYDDFSISGHIKTRYYFGSYEKDIDEFGNVTETDYLYTPVGLTAMQRKTSAGANLYYIHTDLLGSIERITNATGQIISEYTYTPWGGRILLSGVNITDRGYTGHEHLNPFGDDSNGGFCLINMNGRVYDPVLARFLSPDPYVQAPDFTQSFNRYAYCWNNPFRYTDPSGELVWFVPILIGAAIGGISGAVMAKQADAKGFWQWAGYIGGGAVIGALSGGAASGASALGAAAWWAGAAAGAVGGAGFSGLATGWNGEAMLKGAAFGAISGFVGGGIGSAIGGGWGAVAGGASSSGLNTALNGGDLEQIGISMLVGGALSYGTYELTSYISFKQSNLTINNHQVTYKQFKTMQADYQRSSFWRKEYGGILTRNGNVIKAPSQNRHSLRVDFTRGMINAANNDGGIATSYHTHWARGGVNYYVNNFDDIVSKTNALSLVTTSNGPSPGDMNGLANYFGGNQYLIDRNSFYYYNSATSGNISAFMFRYFPMFWW